MANTQHTFEIQEILKSTINYNRWIFDQCKDDVGRRVFDIGSGYGNVISLFIDESRVIQALDVEDKYVRHLNDLYAGAGFSAVCGDFQAMSIQDLREKGFDTVTLFNVLEHFENDIDVLQRAHDILTDKGKLIVVVPALPILFGSMDRADGHYRRYTKKALRQKLNDAGFEIVTLRYMNLPGFFGWFLNGRILKKPLIPAKQAKAYDRIVPVVCAFERIISPPFGQSLVVIGTKK